MNPLPTTANIRTVDLVKRADGAPITSGTVTYYLYAVTGSNAGKWFKAADDSWAAVETSGGGMAHVADGHWYVNVAAGAWTAGDILIEYARESGDLHVPLSRRIRVEYPKAETEADGAVYRFTENALELGPGGLGAGMESITEETLDVNGTALGAVQTNAGAPITGATVAIYADADTSLRTKLYSGVTDGDGGFSIPVPTGATYRVVPVSAGYSFSAKRVTV